jgi:hypothetical protein
MAPKRVVTLVFSRCALRGRFVADIPLNPADFPKAYKCRNFQTGPPVEQKSFKTRGRMLMHKISFIAALSLLLAGCTTAGMESDTSRAPYQSGPNLRPIPGSITYGGQPRTRLTKSPVGSMVQHEFRNEFGELTQETYIVQPDRSLKLATRRVIRSPFGNDDP